MSVNKKLDMSLDEIIRESNDRRKKHERAQKKEQKKTQIKEYTTKYDKNELYRANLWYGNFCQINYFM
jgi:hypothetical protein